MVPLGFSVSAQGVYNITVSITQYSEEQNLTDNTYKKQITAINQNVSEFSTAIWMLFIILVSLLGAEKFRKNS